MIRKQLTISLENRPGTLSRAGLALAKSHVNIEALTVVENTEVGMVRLLVSDTDAARAILEPMGILCVVEKVSAISLPNRPGALANLSARIAKAGVNLKYMYGSAGGAADSGTCLVVISSSDLDRVEELAQSA